MNQVTAVDTTAYAYDADGNLISKTDGGDTWTYTYDVENRLVGAETPEGTWAYEYDPLGNRIAAALDGQRTEYLIDPFSFGDVVAEYDNADALVANYVHGLGLVSRGDSATGEAYYTFDAASNTAGLTDAAGNLANSYVYLPFGEKLTSTETVDNPFTFVGKHGVMDGDDGLYFMRNRSYMADTGRFVSRDSIAVSVGSNLYVYAANSPTRLVDPEGLWPLFASGTTGGSLGAPLVPPNFGANYDEFDVTEWGGPGHYVHTPGGTLQTNDFEPQFQIVTSHAISHNTTLPDPTLCSPHCGPQAGDSTNVVTSLDPNDILGPGGYGTEGFILPDIVMPYTIRCENDPEATASAQVVTITQQLDAELDWATFQLGSFGLGEHTFYVPADLQAYSQRLDMIDEFGLYVDADFALDADTGLVTWQFVSIDPVTGAQTKDPLAGFLPPNDTSPEGEGFVSYTVETLPGLPTGTEITAQASIVFDTNDPIDTNVHVNTIDAGPPTSLVEPLPAEADSTTFNVSWSGTDDTGGSGIAGYDVYVSADGGAFEPWLDNVPETTAAFAGGEGHAYAFFSIAVDHVGHRESVPEIPDAEIAVPLFSDFDGDGDVDDDDLHNWQTGFGTPDNAMTQDGDADRDGDVDGNDFLSWQISFGQSTGTAEAEVQPPVLAGCTAGGSGASGLVDPMSAAIRADAQTTTDGLVSSDTGASRSYANDGRDSTGTRGLATSEIARRAAGDRLFETLALSEVFRERFEFDPVRKPRVLIKVLPEPIRLNEGKRPQHLDHVPRIERDQISIRFVELGPRSADDVERTVDEFFSKHAALEPLFHREFDAELRNLV